MAPIKLQKKKASVRDNDKLYIRLSIIAFYVLAIRRQYVTSAINTRVKECYLQVLKMFPLLVYSLK